MLSSTLSRTFRSTLQRGHVGPAATATLSFCQNNDLSKRFLSSEETQKAHWESYLATGRGSAALFGSIDKDADGKLSPTDVKSFLDTVQRSHVLDKALKLLDNRAAENPLDFAEFQEWLVTSTQEVVDACIHPWYETSPHVGERAHHRRRQLQQEQQHSQSDETTTTTTTPPPQQQQQQHSWNKQTMSQSLRRMQYAVRGEVVMAAEKLAAAGKEIIYTNIGNPHGVQQPPITYYRQVLALCDLPASVGVDHPAAAQLFPADVLDRARELRSLIGPGGTGAYTHSQGIAGFRKHVADFIAQRDGHPAFQGDVFLTNGASSGIELILDGLISCDRDAIMIPIPQYPIYSALITRLGGRQIGYELEEEIGWGVTRQELYRRLDQAHAQGLAVKGLALINPGSK